VSKVVHVTNDALAGYTFPFKVFKPGELAVDLVDASFRVIRLEPGADYTVDGLGLDQGGAITLTAAGREKAGTGQSLVMLRRMDFTQETDYRPHDVFPAETHERALDILTMICQELREMMSRAIIAPPNLDAPIQYADLAALLEDTESAAASALAAAQAAADRAGIEADRAEAAAGSLDLPPLSTASPGQVLTAVEQPDQSLRLEYAFPDCGLDAPAIREKLAELDDNKLDKADYSGFPGDTYIDIPWEEEVKPDGDCWQHYTAPADGWVVAHRTSTMPEHFIAIGLLGLADTLSGVMAVNPTTGLGVYVPMSKGQTAQIGWTAPLADYLRFIPARRAPGL
jgi:hypothetical protein